MLRNWIVALAAGAAAATAGTSTSASPMAGDDAYRVRVAKAADWNPAASEGECLLRMWVDRRARVELRGDRLALHTQDGGGLSRDLGSACNQPLPFERVRDLRIIGLDARGVLLDVQPPSPRNDFTGAFTIDDPQSGGREYEILVSWSNPSAGAAPVAVGPAPWRDEAQACQERVAAAFFRRNPRSGYLEFPPEGAASLPTRYGRDRVQGQGRLHGTSGAWDFTYDCVVTENADRILTATYEVATHGRAY